jgi:hypothetical protein
MQKLLVIPAGTDIVSAKNRSVAQGIMGLISSVMDIVGLLEGESRKHVTMELE